jgi:geranylgeranyl reductase family protein
VKQFDAVIVGAGPAGSAAAITLARSGYSVAILDKEKFPREKLCGDFINPANWPTLQQLGVAEEILFSTGERVDRFRVSSHLGVDVEVPLGRENGAALFGVPMRRLALDALLLSHAKREGAVTLEESKVKSLQRFNNTWIVAAEGPQGNVDLGAKVVVGADGRNSWVAHNQGLVKAGGDFGHAIGFQFLIKAHYPIAGKVEIHLFPGGYVGLLGIRGNLINFCFTVEKSCLEQHGSLDALLGSSVQENSNLKALLGNSERIGRVRSTYPVYFPSRRCYTDGLLLVGDAARVSEPVTGEGIYFALRSGVLAGDALHAAFQSGDLSAASLRRYAQACRRAFAMRRGLNALIRYAMYRPTLLTPLIRYSAKRQRLLNTLVHTLCLPEVSR